MNEIWRDVIGYEGFYEVSDQGRVRSLDRIRVTRNRWGACSISWKGRMLLQNTCEKYLKVCLCKAGKKSLFTAHRLVADAFLGHRPDGMLICHRDDKSFNNAAVNLYYGTPSGNMADAIRNDCIPLGEDNYLAKLTEDAVRFIRANAGKIPQRTMAAHFGVCQRTIACAATGKTWKHVAIAQQEAA